jgi:hypothetical protein
MGFREPTDEEKDFQTYSLVNKRISIYWDGNDEFFPALVLTFDRETDQFSVLYDGPDDQIYKENLKESVWKIWDENYEECDESVLNVRKIFSTIGCFAFFSFKYSLFYLGA